MSWLIVGSNTFLGKEVCKILASANISYLQKNESFFTYQAVHEYILFTNPARVILVSNDLVQTVWLTQALQEKKTPTLFFGTSDNPDLTLIMYAFPHVIHAITENLISDESHTEDFLTQALQKRLPSKTLVSVSVLSEILPVLLAALDEGKFFGPVNATNYGQVTEQWIQDPKSSLKHSFQKESKVNIHEWAPFLSIETTYKYGVFIPIRTAQDSIQSILKYRAFNRSASSHPRT